MAARLRGLALMAAGQARAERLLWLSVFVLAAIGVAAAAGRSVFPTDLATRADPFRTRLLASLDRNDPFAADRPAETAYFDGRFAAHPFLTMLHVVPGGLFLALAPLQFSSRIRARHLVFHRWSGRLLVFAGATSTAPAFYFGLLMPYGGTVEALAIALFGGLFLAALACAFVAIRRKQVARHREWMIRAFALAIAISTVRLVVAAMDVAFTPVGLGPRELFAISVWTGWVVTLGAAELWIRRTRPRALSVRRTLGAPRSTGALRAR